jgi:hypothetical protein
MPLDLAPDLVISLKLDPYAPHAARYHVAQVDRPSPDLRDAVILLTSDLVTRAVQQHRPESPQTVELRVWMPADLVRVELLAPRDSLLPSMELDGPHYELLLLDQIADRWSIDTDRHPACLWFEIDRHLENHELDEESHAPERVDPRGRRSLARLRSASTPPDRSSARRP